MLIVEEREVLVLNNFKSLSKDSRTPTTSPGHYQS